LAVTVVAPEDKTMSATPKNQTQAANRSRWTIVAALAMCALSASAQEAATGQGGQPPTPNAPTIDGAFGLKFGDVFDASKAKLIAPSKWGEVIVGKNQLVYRIDPPKPVAPFEGYYVEVTPTTHKICSVSAVFVLQRNHGGAWEPATKEQKEELEVIMTALANKYGKGESNLNLLYHTRVKGKSVGLIRSIAQLSEDSAAQIVTLDYMDEAVREIANRERAALAESERDAKQRALKEKAKSLDNSGL
jgi:hypothetical protein